MKPRPSAAPRRNDSGLVTLEWLLIVAAAIGLAASSVLAVQQVLDGAAEVPDDPAVRVIDADIAAAFLAEEANAAALNEHTVKDVKDYGQRCQTGIRDAFSDVVDSAVWRAPTTTPGGTESDTVTLGRSRSVQGRAAGRSRRVGGDGGGAAALSSWADLPEWRPCRVARR